MPTEQQKLAAAKKRDEEMGQANRRLDAARARRDAETRQWNKEYRLKNLVGALPDRAKERAAGISSRYNAAVQAEKGRGGADKKAMAGAAKAKLSEMDAKQKRAEMLKAMNTKKAVQ